MKLQSLFSNEKTRKIKKLINLLLVFLYLVIFLKLVNELVRRLRHGRKP